MLRRKFQAELPTRDFTRRKGIILVRMALSGGNFTGDVYLLRTYYGVVFLEGNKLFLEIEPDLLVLFEKRSEIK